MPKVRRAHGPEFKTKAVRQITEGDRPIYPVAPNLLARASAVDAHARAGLRRRPARHLDGWYHREGRHSSLDYVGLMAYEQQLMRTA